MSPEILSNSPQIQELHVTEVVNYLQQNHWMTINHPNPRLLVFENGIDDQGKPIQIVLPSQDDYEDTPYLLTKAVNLLSVLHCMSFQEMMNAITLARPWHITSCRIPCSTSTLCILRPCQPSISLAGLVFWELHGAVPFSWARTRSRSSHHCYRSTCTDR